MTAESPFGPVRKWGTPISTPTVRCYPSTADREWLDLSEWDLEVERALTIVAKEPKPLTRPANLGQLDDTGIITDRGLARNIFTGVIVAAAVWAGAIGLTALGVWWWTR